MKQIKIAIIVGITIISIIIIATSVNKGKTTTDTTNTIVPVSKNDETFSYEEIVKAYEIAEKKGDLETKNTNEAPSSPYEEENDSIVKALQQQVIENTAKDVKPVQSKPKPKKESEDEYKARLRREEEEYYANRKKQINAKKAVKEEKEKFVEISAAFYMDQRLLPGQRVELFLPEKFIYNGMLFKKGTMLYAFISVVEHRIYLDIKKISHKDFDIEVLDFKDGLTGIYDRTGKAKNLWDMYKDENIDNSSEEIEDIIEQSTKSRFFAKTMQSVTKFFKKSKVKEKEKLYFMNDKEVILKIKL